MPLIGFILAAGLLYSCWSDWSCGKIWNRTVLIMLIALIPAHLLNGSIFLGITGFLAGFVLHFLLWSLHVVRGGDAKLMMAVGAAVGWQMMIEVSLWEFILMVPAGLFMLHRRGRLWNMIHHLYYVKDRLTLKEAGPPPPETPMIFAPFIGAAVVVAWSTTWLELL